MKRIVKESLEIFESLALICEMHIVIIPVMLITLLLTKLNLMGAARISCKVMLHLMENVCAYISDGDAYASQETQEHFEDLYAQIRIFRDLFDNY